MRSLRALFILLASGAAVAQQPRMVRPVDSSQLVQVKGSISADAHRAVDLGAATGDTSLANLSLRFNMTAEQQAALSQLLNDQQNPASSRYHQWLTPEQFGAQFGLPPADQQKVSAWLTAQGFHVTQVARGGLFLRFSGTVAQANNAFHLQMHRMRLNGEEHFAALTDPQLPAAIAQVTSTLAGLHDFHPKPPRRRLDKGTPPSPSSADFHPSYTSGSFPNVLHAIAPADLYTIYDEAPLLASGIDGTGVSIAVIGQSDLGSDVDFVAAFRAAAGLQPANVTQVLYGADPGVSPFDEVESLIDLEWAGAGAPGANLIFVRGKDAFIDALAGAIDDNLAPIISSSYTGCEGPDNSDVSINQSYFDAFYPLLLMASAQGQTIVAASGDQGATSCDPYTTPAKQGLAANFPGVSPFVTAVGGTQFSDNSSTYWSATDTGTGGSALSYIPETVWDDVIDGAGSSGGVSRFSTKPYWQTGPGVPADFARDVPDISLSAAPTGNYAGGYLLCSIATFCTNGFMEDSSGFVQLAVGTSFGAPIFAGVLALVNQKTGGPIGNANPVIYALANSPYSNSVFHDVSTGSNATMCLAGTMDCPGGGAIGYSAGAGYDLATGWGSVDISNLVNSWSLVTPPTSSGGQALSDIAISGGTAPVAQGTTIPLTATVTSGSAANTTTPTGTVQFLVDNVPVGSGVALAGGVALYPLDTTNIRGLHTVEAAYSGDTLFAGSRQALPITTTPTAPLLVSATTLTAMPMSVLPGQAIHFTVQVASGSSASSAVPTGSVISLNTALLVRGSASFTLDTTLVSPGSHSIEAQYYGDSKFAGSQASVTYNIISTAPDFSVTPSTTTATVRSGSSVTVPITVASINGFSGNISFSTSTANASVSPGILAITAGGSSSTSLTLNAFTPAAGTGKGMTSRAALWEELSLGVSFAGLVLLALPKRRRLPHVLAVLLAAAVLTVTGCGGASNRSSAPASPTPTPPGTYTITITAFGVSGSTSITHTASITFVVQ